MATTQMRLKLFVDEKNRVFAECGNDFVDVLDSFLKMPMRTIIDLTRKESKIGGMSTLKESVEDLDVSLLQTEACRKMLLNPKNASEEHCKNLKVNIDDTEPTKYCACSCDCCAKKCGLVSTSCNAQCGCGQPKKPQMICNKKAECVAPSKDGEFVKGNMTFIIGDDLKVLPSDSKVKQGISTSVPKKEVKVGKAEVLLLLIRSLLSKTPLTDMIHAFHLNDPAPPQGKGSGSKSNKVSVKLTVNKSNKKVVYAEGGEELTDLLFSFLAFPLGFVAKFFGGDSGVKCLDNLYRSVQVLKKFIESKECERLLVDPNDPKLGPYFSCKNQPLQIREQNPWQPTIIGCVCSKVISGNDVKIIDYSSGGCGHVRPKKQLFTINPKYPSPVKELRGSFIAGRAMFLVTDQLNVKQHSPELGFSLFEKLSIPRTDLEEHVVTVGEVVGSYTPIKVPFIPKPIDDRKGHNNSFMERTRARQQL